MGEYDKVIKAINEHGLSWDDVDRLLLNDETYSDFKERYTGDTSHYSTINAPAVRHTDGTEKIVYVDTAGYLQEIEL